MRFDSVNILGINITISDKKTILEELEKRQIIKKKTTVVVTPNPEQIVLASEDKQFADLLNRADIAIPDGIGVVWANRILGGRKIHERIPGVEFMQDLVSVAVKQSVRVALIGGREDLALKAFECLRQHQPRLSGFAVGAPELEYSLSGLFISNNTSQRALRGKRWSAHEEGSGISMTSGDVDEYVEAIAARVIDDRVRFVFVGLGAPKQELLVDRLARVLNRRVSSPVILMSVGGSFDSIAGTVKRAPLFIRSIGFEWLARLIQEPWRWKRQLAILKFVWLVMKERVMMG